MDEIVIKYYRQMLRKGFEHAGTLENPSIFLDSVGEKLRICAMTVNNYLHLYINIRDGVLEDIKYLCLCDPTANVVAELLCTLAKGKTIEEARALTEESFARALGSRGKDFLERAGRIIELLNRGLARYEGKTA
jgi:NifU-like protein involved in Fe-S cluster formation